MRVNCVNFSRSVFLLKFYFIVKESAFSLEVMRSRNKITNREHF